MEWVFPIALFLGLLSLVALVASPVAGMMAVFIVRPFIDASWEREVLFGLRAPEVYYALIPLLLLVHMALARDDKSVMRMPLKGMWLGYSAYILFFSMLMAQSGDLKAGANIFLRYIDGILGFYFIQAFFRRGDRFKWFLGALSLSGMFPMTLGLYQALTGFQWREAQVEGLTRNIGIWHDGVNMRTYAEQTIFGLLLYTALYVKQGHVAVKATLTAYLAVSTLVMVRVYSKAAMLTCGLWVLCWTILRRQFIVLAVLAVVGLLIITFYAGGFVEKIGTLFHKEIGFFSGQVQKEQTFQGRWFGWMDMMNKWERLPPLSQLFGSGEIATGAHNDFLQMLFHGGIVGLIMYLSMLVVIGVRIGRNLLAKVDEMAVAALMLYLMWVIDAVGLVPSAFPPEQWLVWGVVGLSFRMRADEALQQSIETPEAAVQENLMDDLIPAPTADQRRFPLLSD